MIFIDIQYTLNDICVWVEKEFSGQSKLATCLSSILKGSDEMNKNVLSE